MKLLQLIFIAAAVLVTESGAEQAAKPESAEQPPAKAPVLRPPVTRDYVYFYGTSRRGLGPRGPFVWVNGVPYELGTWRSGLATARLPAATRQLGGSRRFGLRSVRLSGLGSRQRTGTSRRRAGLANVPSEARMLFDVENGYYYYPGLHPAWLPEQPLRPAPAPEAAPPVEQKKEGEQRKAEERPAEPAPATAARRRKTFGSRLSPMLGGPAQVGLEFAVGEYHLRAGRYGQAVGLFSHAMRAEPEEAAPRLALALAFMAVRRNELAARELREGLQLVQDWSVLALDPPVVFGSTRRFQAIRSRIAEAAGRDRSNGDLQLMLGFLDLASGADQLAVQTLRAARDAGARDPVISRLLLEAERRAHRRAGGSGRQPTD